MRRIFAPMWFVSALLVTLGTACLMQAQSSLASFSNHSLQTTSWSFQCPPDSACGTSGEWLPTVSQPGTTRLWNAGTEWYILQASSTAYNWTNLDTWLDLVASHPPTAVIYTFGHTPCFIASVSCGTNAWSATPPSDLTKQGSGTFTAFVTALVKHCSPAGNCVATYVKNWEMWNEANHTPYWTGTATQLYQMFAPVIPIIRSFVPGAQILTPPSAGGAQWAASWIQLENTNGRLSDVYSFHQYLWDQLPEQRMSVVAQMISAKNNNGWTKVPWLLSETNYDVNTYACAPQYTQQDCQGQLVRWHVLLYAYQGGSGGATLVGWYNWPTVVPGGYDTVYYTMMKWLVGATFTASCSNNGTVYTCPLSESNGASGLIVWNTAGNSSYTPATQYLNYREFNGTYGGTKISISPGQSTTIGVIPIMFQTK